MSHTTPTATKQPSAVRTSGRVMSPAMAGLGLGFFMIILDTTIVNVALPALRTDLGASVAGLQWVVDSYLLMLAALLLSGGALADRTGARRIFQLGLGLFIVASVGCGLAPNIEFLIITRVIQGAGATLAVPASLALVRASYPEPAIRARAIGVWSGIAGAAAAAGPILGGVLVTADSWRLVFFVNVPIGLAAMALTARHVPAPEARPHPLDAAGQATGMLALAALTVALIEGGHTGFSPLVIVATVVFVASVTAFLAIERAVQAPMLPLGLFRNSAFSGGNAVGLLINLGFYGELFVLNLYFQQILHYSALMAGLALLPQMGTASLAALLSGWFTSRAGGPRPTMLIGLILGGAGLLGLIVAGAHTHYAMLVVPLLAAGFGMSFTMPAATTAVIDGAPGDRAGLASPVINSARQLGSVIGVALFGALVAASGAFIPGLRIALAIAGAAFFTGAILTVLTVSHHQPAAAQP